MSGKVVVLVLAILVFGVDFFVKWLCNCGAQLLRYDWLRALLIDNNVRFDIP